MNYARMYKTLSEMKAVADTVLKETYVGSSWDVDKIAREYPLMVIDNMAKPHQYQQGMMTLNLDLYVVDIYNQKLQEDTDDYIIQLQSDMTALGTDYINYLSDSSLYDFHINKQSNPTFIQFKEKWIDEVAGVKFELVVQIPDDGNYCENVFEENYTPAVNNSLEFLFSSSDLAPDSMYLEFDGDSVKALNEIIVSNTNRHGVNVTDELQALSEKTILITRQVNDSINKYEISIDIRDYTDEGDFLILNIANPPTGSHNNVSNIFIDDQNIKISIS